MTDLPEPPPPAEQERPDPDVPPQDAGTEPAPEPERRGGRRRRTATRRRRIDLWSRRLVLLAEQVLRYRYATAALVLLAVLALYGVAALSRPAADGAAAGARIPVTTAVLACPAPGGSTVGVLAPPSSGTGRADVISSENGAVVASPARPGVPWSQEVEGGPDAYTIRAQGAQAAGLQAERTTYYDEGADRGLAAARCTGPGVDHWFLGPGPLEADLIDVHLTNVDAQPATVDLTALSGDGPLDTVDGRGIPVEPGTTKVIRLGDAPEGLGEIVRTAQIVALKVHATAGRVAAAVRVRIGEEKGVDWLPPAGAPATALTVPGVPGDAGTRRLLVAVPGQDDARIRIRVITESGSFAPEGQDTFHAPAGTVTPLALERALSGKPAAVRLTADRPIVAGFTAERGGDVGYGAATAPLGEAGGVIADNRFESVLLLTAPDGAASVRVATVNAQGAAGAPRQVRIAAGRTAEVELSPPAGTDEDAGFGVLVVPQPGSGPVHAARIMATGRDGRLFTVLPVTPAQTTLLLPPVLDSQRAVLP
ncbi:DUF5719 family protein [Thermomonospora cellulosilytica]|uniref:Uncharacterized protein n=1 Tax=Thermomonospora cellulosilytica TaxID=1411118 RepID=A0A7W3N5M5_9ACTN|nr:DUF5719 family protein [Thermomonospora cellulosilytica]MBA9007912.1 hypothetical protein [Thermomonospora cellulosilytica]